MDFQQLVNVDLIKELGLDQLPKERQEEILIQIGEVMQQRVILRVVEEMKDDDKQAFNSLLDSQAEAEAIHGFLTQKVPDLEKIIMEEVGKYKGELLEFINNITQ